MPQSAASSHLTLVQGARTTGVCRRTPDALMPDGCDRSPTGSHGFCPECFEHFKRRHTALRTWADDVSLQVSDSLAGLRGPDGVGLDSGLCRRVGDATANFTLLALDGDLDGDLADTALVDVMLDMEADRERRATSRFGVGAKF